MRPGIKHPENETELELILKIAEQARTARDVAKARHQLPADTQELESAAGEQWTGRELLDELGFKHVKQKRRGFQSREYYTVPTDL